MIELLDDYIRVTELQYRQANKPEENFDMEELEKLIEERGKILKRIETVKQYLTDEDLKTMSTKIEKMKRLDDRNEKAFKEYSKRIRVKLDNMKKRKSNFQAYRKNL
jgi:hypothetical protein